LVTDTFCVLTSVIKWPLFIKFLIFVWAIKRPAAARCTEHRPW